VKICDEGNLAFCNMRYLNMNLLLSMFQLDLCSEKVLYATKYTISLDKKSCFHKLESLRKLAWNTIIKFQLDFRSVESPFMFQLTETGVFAWN